MAEIRNIPRRRGSALAVAAMAAGLAAAAAAGTLSGTIVSPLGGPIAGATLWLRLSQGAVQPGSYAIAPQAVSCYTTRNGGIVGLPDPAAAPTGAAFAGAGTLPAGVYFVEFAYQGGSAQSLASPEAQLSLNSAGRLQINPPAQAPAGASAYEVFIGASSGSETLQGTAALTAAFSQALPLSAGAPLPGANTSSCSLLFNDALIPSFTFYSATLLDGAGNVVAGFPQNWYLAGSAADVSNLVPLASNPAVRFPMPVLANPASNAAQSLASGLQLNGYNIAGSGNLGPGYFPGGWNGAWPATGTVLAQWTPNAAVTLRRLDINAQTAGSGGTTGSTVSVSGGAATCTFPGLLPGAARSSSAAASGNCNFGAGLPLTVTLTGDDHGSPPQNLSWSIELTGWL